MKRFTLTLGLVISAMITFGIPTNNTCKDAILLSYTGSCNFQTYSNDSSTQSNDASPSCASNYSTDVWFKVVVPGNGVIVIDTRYVNVRTAMAAYTGTCGSLTQYTCDGSSSVDYQMPYFYIEDKSLANDTLFIQLWGDNGSTGSFKLCAFAPTQPANKDCSTPAWLNVQSTCSYKYYTTAYAGNSGVGTPTCGSFWTHDVWFETEVPKSGRLILWGLNNGIGNSAMALYEGECDSLNQFACNDNSGPTYQQPQIYLNDTSRAGDTIKVRMWKVNSLYGGSFGICAFEPKVDTNEVCKRARYIEPEKDCKYVTYTNQYYTSSGDASPGCGSYIGTDAWFRTRIPSNGRLVLTTRSGSAGGIGMALYRGDCDSLILVRCATTNGPNYSMPEIILDDSTLADQEVYIMIWRRNSIHGGTFDLCLYTPDYPQNSHCSLSQPMDVLPACNFTSGTTRFARNSGDGNPSCGNYTGSDVWYSFVVPRSGKFTVMTKNGSISDMAMSLYTGSCGALKEYQCADDGSTYYSRMPGASINDTSLSGKKMYVQLWAKNNHIGGSFWICIYGDLSPEIRSPRGWELCKGDSIPPLSVYDGVFQYNWYDARSGGNLLASDTAVYHTTTPGKYYVDATNPVTLETSDRTEIELVINDLPEIIGLEDQAYCEGDSVPVFEIDDLGAYYSWYDSTGHIAGRDTNKYKASYTGIYSVQAVDLNTGCESDTQTVVLTEWRTPYLIDPRGVEVCTNEAIPAMSVIDSNEVYNWFRNNDLTDLVAANSPTLTSSVEGFYFVQAIDSFTGCRSRTARVELQINDTPRIIVPSLFEFCESDPSHQLSVTDEGHIYTWFEDRDGTRPLRVDDPDFTPAQAATYFVQAMIDTSGCKSPMASVRYVVNSNPEIALVATDTQKFCASDPDQTLRVNDEGHVYSWFEDRNGNKPLKIDDHEFAPFNEGTFFVQAMNDATGCKSEFIGVTYVVHENPEVVYNAADTQQFCASESSVTLMIDDSGDLYKWYSDASLQNLLAEGTTSLEMDFGGAVYVQAMDRNTSCVSSVREIQVVQNANPTVGAVYEFISCDSNGYEGLRVKDEGLRYDWYTQATGGNMLQMDHPSYFPSDNGLYWVEAIDPETGCVSTGRVPLELIIYPQNKVIISKQDRVLYSSDAISYQWYVDDVAQFGQTEQSTEIDVSGSYHVEVIDSNGCSRKSDAVVIDLTSSRVPVQGITNVYPNPVDEFLYMEKPGQLAKLHWEIIDMRGALVKSGSFDSAKEEVLLTELKAGMYLLKMRSEHAVNTIKIIKK